MKTFALTLVALLATARPTAAQQPDPAEDRVARLERLVAEMQLQIEQLQRERHPGTPAPETSSVVASHPADSDAPASPDRRNQVGPLEWNGEFRLYFDSLTRPASPDTPAAANSRGRYLLYLNARAPVHRTLDVRARLSTGALNNPLTDIQDFGGGTAKHPFSIAEAYVDFHPNPRLNLQGGRLDSLFNDRARFLFDIDTRFNGFNESFSIPIASKSRGVTGIRFVAGQYFFTNPNIPSIDAEVPSTAAGATPSQALLASGAGAGRRAKVSALFQQGVVVEHRLSESVSHQFELDLGLFREPNQLALLSTPGGLFLVSTSIGTTPSSPLPSVGNGTTTPTGGQFAAPAFRILHADYRLDHHAIRLAGRDVPATFDVQFARNLGAGFENNALLLTASAGQATPRRARLAYAFYRKEANALIGQLTENDIGVGSSVNMATHFIRFDYGVVRNVTVAGNLSVTSFLSSSDRARSFFVPFGSGVPTEERLQLMLVTRF